jgi:hypothetical protein
MKKILALLTTMALALVFASSVSAATDINAHEQKLIDKFTEGAVIDGKTVALSTEEINLAKNFFMRDEIDLTEEDVDGLLAAIDEIIAIAQAAKAVNFSDLSSDDKLAVVAIAEAAVAAIASVELTFSYDFDTNIASILGVGGVVLAQSEVGDDSTVIKATANDLTMTWVILAGLILLVGASYVVANKKGYFNQA